MKKSTSIISIVILVALLVVFGITCTTGFTNLTSGKLDFSGGAAANIPLGLDLEGGVSITYQVVGDTNPSNEDMSDTIYKLQQRVENYSTESVVYQEGTDRINIEIPGVSDANEILAELGKPGALYFIRETDAEGNMNYGYTVDENGNLGNMLARPIEDLIATGDVVLTGTDVKAAQAGSVQDQMKNNEFIVSLSMTDEGTVKFAEATKRAFANGESIAIYYDGEIVSAPNVQAEITNGSAQITGNFTYDEAEKLASTIRIGGLKLELEELHSKVVGAQLGEEAISTSVKAALIGFVAIVLFMVIAYRISGVAASIALALYVELIVILLDAFEITLTLPGIAGIILSIGMAVDANVIIFARIREELAKGKTVASSIDIGFKKATSAILDGNITTLIAAAVLGILGTGPIKGFASTLALGIILSMFTAMVITRLIMKAMLALGAKSEKLYGIGKERKPIDFLKHKTKFFIISAALIICGFVFMGIHGAKGENVLNYSLDFVGGTSTEVEFATELSLSDIDAQVIPVIEGITNDGNVQTQKIDNTTDVIFKTRSLNDAERENLENALAEKFGAKINGSETISSTISGEMKADAIIAVIVASILMLIYIWFRFKDVRFGCSSVLALIHDVLVVLAFYAVVRVSVGSTFIACMLTIVGYSINATIVIFDRIRENKALMGNKDSLDDVVNNSITQTLSRSVFTSLTTFIMVCALYVLGVTSIKEFALPLMAGILCGTYSSICLASAFYMVLRKVWKQKKEA